MVLQIFSQFPTVSSLGLECGSDRIYLEHMWTGRYWLIKVDIMVSADLSGIQKATGQPVRWSIIVRIGLFPELEVLHSVTRSMAILLNGLSGISVIRRG